MILKDPATMTAEERIAAFEQYVAREKAGDELTVEEYRHCIGCLAGDRAAAARIKRQDSATARKASKITGVPLSVEDLI